MIQSWAEAFQLSDFNFILLLETLLFVCYLLYLIGMTVTLLLDNKPAQSSIAWILTIYLLPFVGLFVYILAGVNWKKRKLVKQRPEEIFNQQLEAVLERQRMFVQHLEHQQPSQSATDSDIRKTVRLLLNSNASIVTQRNRCEIFHHGATLFPALKADLNAAKQFIHMEFFIWKSDSMGEELKAILIAKAQQGVEVRLIFDAIGSFRMSRRYREELKLAGIEFRFFLNSFRPFGLKPIAGIMANYLNHRKIVVIDGQISYLGGMNIGDEYLTGGKRFAYWRDTHLRLEGEITQQLQTVFATDWFNTSHQLLDDQKYFPLIELEPSESLPIQLACSGPDSDWATIKQLLFNMIINANRTVYIQSPYFIPDQGMLTAMETAALSGVAVHLMITGVPDKIIPYLVAETYFEGFLRAGGYIYRYEKGFMHAKTIIVDDIISSVGTCNMDVRAFELDYEVNAVIYNAEVARELKAQFMLDLADCRVILLEDVAHQTFWVRLRNSFLRLFSPLL